MKKLTIALIILFAGLFCLVPAQAANAVDVLEPVCNTAPASDSTVCRENSANANKNPLFGPDGVLTTIMKWLARIVGIAAVLVIAIAGFSLVSSGGESNEAAKARRAIVYAAVGLVIALFAQVLVSFVLSKLAK